MRTVRCRTLFGAFDDDEELSMETEIRQLKQKVAAYERQKRELEEAVVGLNIKFRGTNYDSNTTGYVRVFLFISSMWCPGFRDINTATTEQL